MTMHETEQGTGQKGMTGISEVSRGRHQMRHFGGFFLHINYRALCPRILIKLCICECKYM